MTITGQKDTETGENIIRNGWDMFKEDRRVEQVMSSNSRVRRGEKGHGRTGTVGDGQRRSINKVA